MASLPARPQSQPRSASSESPQESSTTLHQPTSLIDDSEQDSQNIFTQKPKEQQDGEEDHAKEQPVQTPPRFLSSDDDPNVKKCWICFSDSTEDTPETSVWRNPCPCALVAHEECLLDWIADTESPNNPRNRELQPPKLECPQCKAEIKLTRPNDYLVNAVRSLEIFGGKMIIPGAALVLSGVVYCSSIAWGIHSVYAIFGRDDGFRILRPIIDNATRAPVEVYVGAPREAARQLVALVTNHTAHWRLYVGLPLVSPILIFSRTSIADGLLPVLPILFFAGQGNPHLGGIAFADWPPSASFAFALLPYVRSVYNLYYQVVWADLEQQWLKQIQPRSNHNETEEEAANRQNDPNVNGQQGDGRFQEEEVQNIFELRIDGGRLLGDWDDDEGQVPQQQPQQPDLQPAPAQANAIPQAPQNNPPNQPQQPAAERRVSFSPLNIAETILGAMIFPTIAGLTGELLKVVLPRAWTTAPVISTINGGTKLSPMTLLQQKWGRSLIGGCLFVVAKDAVMLYVRWKMAQMHRSRKVVDYKGKDRGK